MAARSCRLSRIEFNKFLSLGLVSLTLGFYKYTGVLDSSDMFRRLLCPLCKLRALQGISAGGA